MLTPKEKNRSAGGSQEDRTRVAVSQDSEPNTLPTELFRPQVHDLVMM